MATAKITVPFRPFIFKESLSSLLRRAGFNQRNHQTTNTPTDTSDDIAHDVSIDFQVALYLTRGQQRTVYNPEALSTVFVLQSEDTLETTQDEDPAEFTVYDPSSRNDNDVEMVDLKEVVKEEKETELEIMVKTMANTIPAVTNSARHKANIKHDKSVDDLHVGTYDLFILSPKGDDAFYVEGYNETDVVQFRDATMYSRQICTPLLRIHMGAAVCLINKVTDIVVMDAAGNPLQFIEFYPQLCSFIKGVNNNSNNNKLTALGRPLVKSLTDLVDDDVATRFSSIKRSKSDSHESSFEYELKSGGFYKSTMSHLMQTNSIMTDLLCVQSSDVCMSLQTVQAIMGSVETYIPQNRSVLYSTVHKFVDFLFYVGYDHQLVYFDDLPGVSRMFNTLMSVKQELDRTGGTGLIDMRLFQPFETQAEYFLRMHNYYEQTTGRQLKL
ncbi:hypothetical protein RRG08_061445 [Elysia crispata]|uniref:Uncharacterized protein n=1 Tax=Elysia crispata TaxID=231223 RepID=A0AAE0YU97_9GAST|nr:hypothetical protein RRG08_061445 [Elysia crispata]